MASFVGLRLTGEVAPALSKPQTHEGLHGPGVSRVRLLSVNVCQTARLRFSIKFGFRYLAEERLIAKRVPGKGPSFETLPMEAASL